MKNLPDKFIPLTPEDIAKIKKIARPVKILLLVIAAVFGLFASIVSYNLPYFWVVIGVCIFPAIPICLLIYVHILTILDIKAGKLLLLQGNIKNKITEDGSMDMSGTVRSRMAIQTYYYIYVKRKKIEVDEKQYNSLKIGERVEVTMTLWSKTLISINKYQNLLNLLAGI